MSRTSQILALVITATAIATLVLGSGCARRLNPDHIVLPSAGPPPESGPPIGVNSQLDIPHPLFAGLGDVLAGDGYVRLSWQAATDDDSLSEDIVYHVYRSSVAGGEDFLAAPFFTTGAGETTVEFTGLTNGEPIYFVVRAADELGNVDPNEVEWSAMPNPVRYVRVGGAGPDGLTPQTAFPTILTAVVVTEALEQGVNIWVAEGVYSQVVFLWPGRSAYGGFTTDFTIEDRDTIVHVSTLEITSLAPVVRMRIPSDPDILFVPGALAVLDGFNVRSAAGSSVPIGVLAEDSNVRITNCLFFNLLSQGIDLRSDFLNSIQITATIRNCTIQDVGGEGIFINGHPNIVIDNNVIQNTGTEGIESQWVHASGNTSARIEVTRNRILNPGDEGIVIDFSEEDVDNPLNSLGARIRAFIRNNKIEGAGLQGIQLDLDFQNSDEIDFRARIEDNEINDCALEGILLDGDARGSFRVVRNSITGNGKAGDPITGIGTAGIAISGNVGGPYARLLHNRIIGNGVGIFATGAITAEVQHQILRANSLSAVRTDRAVVTVANSILMENGSVSTLTSLRSSIVFGEPVPTRAENTVSADPGLESHPRFYARVNATASPFGTQGSIPLGSTSGWFVGDTVELRNDGVARLVTFVGPTSLGVSPPSTIVFPNDLVAAWGDSPDVIEREGLLLGSPAIDMGEPGEFDRDGTPADIGPIGGDTPGNVGIETAIPLESAALELVAIDPSPAELQSGSIWTLTFNRDLVPEIASLVTFSRGAADLTPSAVITLGERTIDFDLSAVTFTPGDDVVIEIAPGEFTIGVPEGPFDDLGTGGGDLTPPGVVGTEEVLLLPSLIRFSSKIGADVFDLDIAGGPEFNGTVATAQNLPTLPVRVSGALGVLGDVDVYSFTLGAGETIRPELYVRQIESTLTTRLTLIASDGSTIVSSDAALTPFYFDPTLPEYTATTAETVYVTVQSSYVAKAIPDVVISPTGDYELILR